MKLNVSITGIVALVLFTKCIVVWAHMEVLIGVDEMLLSVKCPACSSYSHTNVRFEASKNGVGTTSSEISPADRHCAAQH